MRTLLMVLMIAGLMSTVGVYAASTLGTATLKTVGGTGTAAVSAPTSGGVSIAWSQDASGAIVGATVTWTPAVDADYMITVTAGSTVGTLAVASSGTAERTSDLVTLSATAPDAVTSAEVIIVET